MSRIGAPRRVGGQRLQQRALHQIALGEDVLLQPGAVDHAFGLRQPDRHHLRGVVPLVDGRGDVQPLVALQPDQLAAERSGEHLGDLRLADPRLSFQQDGPTHLEGEEHDGRQRAVGDVIA